MKFNVFFQANGVAVIEAKSQADAEAKAENLTDEQIAEGIDDVTILNVEQATKKSGSAKRKCPQCGKRQLRRMTETEIEMASEDAAVEGVTFAGSKVCENCGHQQ